MVNTVFPHNLSPDEIDRSASASAAQSHSLYTVDVEALERIRPEFIVTQELCDVCGVSTSHLAKTLGTLSSLIDCGLGCDMERYAEVKAMLGGATSVVGSFSPTERNDRRIENFLPV